MIRVYSEVKQSWCRCVCCHFYQFCFPPLLWHICAECCIMQLCNVLPRYIVAIVAAVVKGDWKSDILYNAAYMSRTRDQNHFTISKMAADWPELMIPLTLCGHPASKQLDLLCSQQTYQSATLCLHPISYHSFPVSLRVGGWVDLMLVWCSESAKLQQDLMKIMQLDTKVSQELTMLRERIDKMTTELETYSNIDKLKHDAETKKKVCFALWFET